MTTWAIRALLVVIPIIVGVYWMSLRKRHSGDKPALRRAEYQLAAIGGAAFLSVFAFLIFAAPQGSGKPGDFYIAPYEQDGKIIGSEFVSQEEARRRGLIKESDPPKDDSLETFGD